MAISSLLGCGLIADKIGDAIEDKLGELKTYDDFKEKAKNYSITLVSGNNVFTIKICEDAKLYENNSNITFFNIKEKKIYVLDKNAKTGYVYADEELQFDWENQSSVEILLFPFEFVILFMKKGNKDKVAGRNCDICTYEAQGTTARYWLDSEYGICLKYEITNDDGTSSMEVTHFSVNTVTLQNIIDLSEYTIRDGGDFGA